MASRLTGKEIAEQTGFSVSTVSIVLNGKPGVSEETREKILAFVENSGRDVKKTAKKNFSSGEILFCKVATSGNVVADRNNAFISDYVDGIIDECNTAGYSVEVKNFNNEPISAVIEDIRKHTWISGCIVLATELSSDNVSEFGSLTVPVVFVDGTFPMIPGHFVGVDNSSMVFTLVRYLKKHGHTRIGLLKNREARNFRARSTAFHRAMTELELEYNENWVFNISSTYDNAYEDVNKLLDSGIENMPTAFIAVSDVIAVAAIRAFREHGIAVPEDVSFVGFDNLPLAAALEPGLTTMDVQKAAIGRYSVRMLIDSISGKSEDLPNRSTFCGRLIERGSVA